MTTLLYANLGKGGSDGQTATNPLLAGGGDNPLIIGGASGWVFSAADRSPDGPSDGHGYRRTPTGAAAYLRSAFEPTGSRSGAAAWFYIPQNPSADTALLRLVNAAEGNVANVYIRTNGTFRPAQGSTQITGSHSPAITPGWWRIELIADHSAQRMWFRVLDADGDEFHTWDSGASGVSLGSVVAGARFGEPEARTHGMTPIRLGSRVVWGSVDSGWIPRDVDPHSDEPDPPPDTTAVSHYNTAEGLTVNDLAPIGDGIGTEGHRLSARHGEGGSVRVTSDAIHGTRAYRVQAGSGQSGYVQWGFTARQVAFRAYLDVPAAPPASTQIMILRNEPEEPIARLVLANTSQVLLQCVRGAQTSTQTLPGVIVYPAQIRLELFVDVESDVIKAAWGYEGGPREGTAQITDRDLESVPVTLAQVGKMHNTAWAADFVLDDLALNIRAEDHIGAYAPSYDLVSTVAADLPADEPGTTFELEGFGTGTWTQVPTPGMPTVPITQAGTKATGRRPYTVDGGTLEFSYGGATQRVGVLYATETLITDDGEVPLESELIS